MVVRWTKLFSFLAAGSMYLAATTSSTSAEKRFPEPMLGSYRLDICRDWGENCGKPAADVFCQQNQMLEAASFVLDEDIGGLTPTKVIGSGDICDADFCDGFMEIVCVSGETKDPGVAQQPRVPEELLIAAEGNDPTALITVAMAHLKGMLDYSSPEEAVYLLESAAGQGDRRAMLLLSFLMEAGIGTPAHEKSARQLLWEAADLGLPEALFLRAEKTAETDPSAAFRDIRLAAAQGYVPALEVYDKLETPASDRTSNSAQTTRPGDAPNQTWQPSEMQSGSDPAPANDGSYDRMTVMAIQAMLNQLGFDAGSPDGNLTTSTVSAIVLFQLNQNMPTDGKPTVAVRDKLMSALSQGGTKTKPAPQPEIKLIESDRLDIPGLVDRYIEQSEERVACSGADGETQYLVIARPGERFELPAVDLSGGFFPAEGIAFMIWRSTESADDYVHEISLRGEKDSGTWTLSEVHILYPETPMSAMDVRINARQNKYEYKSPGEDFYADDQFRCRLDNDVSNAAAMITGMLKDLEKQRLLYADRK